MASLDSEESERRLVFDGRKLFLGSAIVALVGWLAVAIGWAIATVDTYVGYLTAFAFVTSIALGGLIFLMITYVVRARWNVVVRRLNEAITSVFPVLAVLFVPLAFGLDHLYVWVSGTGLSSEAAELLEHKRPYLNVPFFIGRTALYFAVWIVVAFLLRHWSLARDREAPTGAAPEYDRERTLSSALLPIVALALTFAAFDWLMSLQPLWYSTIFGVYYFAGGFVASLGLLTVLAFAARRSIPGEPWIRPPHFHALGRLMLGFTVLWAYIAFFQVLLIQIANKPEEVEFYVERTRHGWGAGAALLFFGRFVLPFFVLLLRSIKFDGKLMAIVGGWIVVLHYVDVFWLVAPSHATHGPIPNVWDLAALAAVGGTTVAFGAFLLRGKAMVPVNDPALLQSIEYRSPL